MPLHPQFVGWWCEMDFFGQSTRASPFIGMVSMYGMLGWEVIPMPALMVVYCEFVLYPVTFIT